MDDSLMVDVAGLRMFGRPGLSPFVVKEDGLVGWDDGVDMRGERVSRPTGHGSFALPGLLDSRTVSVEGLIHARSAGELALARNRLAGVLAGGSLGRVQVAQAGVTQWAQGMLSAKPTVRRRRGTYYADFQVQLWFPDPRQFGDTQSFVRTNGAVSVFHRGNFDALPSIVVRGSAANGYRLNGPGGKQYRVSRPLVSGRPHRIEFGDGLLRVDGVLMPNGTDRSDVWPVPPGQDVSFDVNVLNGGTAEATITVTDTYI